MVEALGLTACVVTTFAITPQAIKTIKTKRTEHFSMLWLVLMLVGMGLWTSYGIMLNSISLVVSSVVSLVLYSIIFLIKFQQFKT